jgi:hypothetical protein
MQSKLGKALQSSLKQRAMNLHAQSSFLLADFWSAFAQTRSKRGLTSLARSFLRPEIAGSRTFLRPMSKPAILPSPASKVGTTTI